MIAIPIVQNGALSCMCFDEYRTLNQAPCVNGCIPMVDYLVFRALVALAPCNDPTTGSIRFPGESSNSNSELFSTEAGKKFVHSLFEGIWSVVKQGKYFRNITEENIFVSREGSVRLHNVEIMDRGTKNQRKTRARQNYHQVCNIAMTKFKAEAGALGHPNVIPCDIHHLFQRVMADKVLYNIDLYHIHISLVPIGVGLLSFFKMHDHLMTTVDHTSRNNILDNLYGCPEFTKDVNGTPNWVTDVFTNSLLKKVYNHNQGSYIVNDHNISKKMDIALKDVFKMRMDPNQRYEYNETVKRTEVAVFLDFLRNRTAHRMQSWRVRTLEYLPEEADYACLLKFRLFLAKVQWHLWVEKKFDKINFSAFF